jgi:hypothetical protein
VGENDNRNNPFMVGDAMLKLLLVETLAYNRLVTE